MKEQITEICRASGQGAHPPDWKDWNEALKARNGVEAEPAEEHPQLTQPDSNWTSDVNVDVNVTVPGSMRCPV